MTRNPSRGNVIEASSTGNAEIVLALAGDSQHALPMLSLTDTYESNWLIELTGAELVRLFLQLANLLTADEDDVHEWVDDLRNAHSANANSEKALQKGKTMQFTSNQPAPTRRDEPLVSLAELALELTGGDIAGLARQIPADTVQLDDIGRRCVTRATARWLFTQRAERQAEQARREAQWRKEQAERSARYRAQRRGGVPATPGSTPLADLMGAEQR